MPPGFGDSFETKPQLGWVDVCCHTEFDGQRLDGVGPVVGCGLAGAGEQFLGDTEFMHAQQMRGSCSPSGSLR